MFIMTLSMGKKYDKLSDHGVREFQIRSVISDVQYVWGDVAIRRGNIVSLLYLVGPFQMCNY